MVETRPFSLRGTGKSARIYGTARRVPIAETVPRPFGPAMRQRQVEEAHWTDHLLAAQRRVAQREANAERAHNNHQNPNPPARRRL